MNNNPIGMSVRNRRSDEATGTRNRFEDGIGEDGEGDDSISFFSFIIHFTFYQLCLYALGHQMKAGSMSINGRPIARVGSRKNYY